MQIPANEPPLGYLSYALPPRPEDVTADALLDAFLAYVRHKGLELYPAQEQAILEILEGKNVILATPTGSGKSLVAEAMHFQALALGERSVYTAPIKALVNEKFFALCRDFGTAKVGLLTGDASVNPDAPILCCTAEILSNMALRKGEYLNVGYVIVDEFHYYSDRDRGVAWQIPLLSIHRAIFLLMSATFGDAEPFRKRLTALNGLPTAVVTSSARPVPLDYEYRETPLHETLLDLVKQNKVPVYLVNFTQRACAEEAQNLMSQDYCTKDEKRAIAEALRGVRFDTPYGKEVQKFVRHGVGLHHAGLLPKYRLLVEKLAQRGYLKIIVGTDTLGVGVNIPIRTVLFSRLCKFDGQKTALLSAREFHQIAGRAGRKGFDDRGSVVVQAPEHVIENLRMEGKVANDPAKKRKLVRKRAPERNYVHWDRGIFERVVQSPPESLTSRFSVNHGMIINVLQRGQGCRPLARLIRDCHENKHDKRVLGRTALQMFRSLLDASIVGFDEAGKLQVTAVLQDDFSLNRTLSLFLVEAMETLDQESPTYGVDLVTLVESILENPDFILMRQLDRLKGEKVAELKAQGMEYEERMEELQKLEYPKPNAEVIYELFNAFAKHHPWVGGENIRPKTIAREMFETFQAFTDYEKDYGLERAEGQLLRYLSGVYKTLVQTVPPRAKTEQVSEIITFLGAIVRSTDCSLLEEWERMQRGDLVELPAGEEDTVLTVADRVDVTRDERGFTVLVRNALFSLLRLLARRDFEGATACFEGNEEPWTATQFQSALAPYFEAHATIRLDPPARIPQHTRMLSKDEHFWNVEQVICDPEEDNDWYIRCRVDLAKSRTSGHPVIAIEALGT